MSLSYWNCAYLRFHIYAVIYSSDIRNSGLPATPEENTQAAILAVLRYFEIFKHPLTLHEIGQYLSVSGVDGTELETNMQALVAAGKAWCFTPYFQSSNDAQWPLERIEKNSRADKILPKAYSMGRFIGHFPFIKAVMVSGSLSKHCMAHDGDIDFFLITAPGRLWLARTLLVLYKKVFLFNSHKYFCINYLIDTEHLEIEEKNIFTATECATLLPIFNTAFYHKFINANAWAYRSFYPNFPARRSDNIQNEPPKSAGMVFFGAYWSMGRPRLYATHAFFLEKKI